MSQDLSFRFRWTMALRDDEPVPQLAKHLGLELSFYMDADGGSCFPSVSLIARKMHCTDRAVQKYLAVLESLGYLQIERSKGGIGHPNHYQATLPTQP